MPILRYRYYFNYKFEKNEGPPLRPSHLITQKYNLAKIAFGGDMLKKSVNITKLTYVGGICNF